MFPLTISQSLKCSEAPDEPESVTSETLYQLSCFIDKGTINMLYKEKHFASCMHGGKRDTLTALDRYLHRDLRLYSD